MPALNADHVLKLVEALRGARVRARAQPRATEDSDPGSSSSSSRRKRRFDQHPPARGATRGDGGERSGMIHGATLAPPVFRLPFSPEINQELPVDLINYTQLGETSAEPNPLLP